MKQLSAATKIRLIWRSLWIQVLLNYKTMQGGGYLFILWPWLKTSEHRAARVKRASGYINGHPVFSAFALGAMLKRLGDGDAEQDTEDFDEWRESLAGPLGMVGDALIWERWKPALLALGVSVAAFLTVFNIASTPTISLIIPLSLIVAYNAPLFALRWWALDQSFSKGKDVLSLGAHPKLRLIQAGLDKFTAVTGAYVATLALLLIAFGISGISFGLSLAITFVLLRLRVSTSVVVLIALISSIIITILVN